MSQNQPYRILIVEDDDLSFMYLTAAFETESIQFDRVITGQQAIDMIYEKRSTYDLILMDIKLPGIDGFETAQKIRKIIPQIPIIAQTALYIPSELERFNKSGFNGVLFKPFLQEDLMAQIHNCLNKTKKSTNHIEQNV